jgi:hypothetical protein
MPGMPPVEPVTHAFYARVISHLNEARAPYLIGGGYALARYTGIERQAKDLDIFIRERDFARIMSLLSAAGCTSTALTYPHWLGKARCGEDFVDVIFSSGNALTAVDDEWFAHAVPGEVLGLPVRLNPAEEMIWSKSFIMERERFDGADVMHLLRARAPQLDWQRLVRRFNSNWRVLLSHVLMFGYVYPDERPTIPTWVTDELLARLQREMHELLLTTRLCRGTLVSREQYLTDVGPWGYVDARLPPHGNMQPADVELWTEAITRRG